MAAPPAPAFAAGTACTPALASTQTHARRTLPRTQAPPKTPVVLRPAQQRRVRLAHQRRKPTRINVQPTNSPPNNSKRVLAEAAAELQVKAGDVVEKKHVEREQAVDEDLLHEEVAEQQEEEHEVREAPEDLLQSNEQHDKARAQKEYLDDQLAKRQATNLLKKQKRNRPSKRVRPVTPSAVSRRNAVVLKDTFQAYMGEIGRTRLLDQAEVIDLATRIKRGVAVEETQKSMESELGRRPSIPELAKKLDIDVHQVQERLMAGTAAKNALVAANLRLVTSVARKIALTKSASTAGIALDDMVQEGNVGLIRAAEKFDASRGYRFSTYATWWVRAYVMRSITTQSRSIKVPCTLVDEYSRIRKQYAVMREKGIFKPTEEEIAHELGITAAKLRFVVKVVTQVPTSLDLSLDPGGDSANSRSLGEIVQGDDNIEERMVENLQRMELDMALRNCLRPLERAVIRLRFGLDDGQPRTLRETGTLLGLSKERIRQLLFRALPKMKTPEIQQMLIDATAR